MDKVSATVAKKWDRHQITAGQAPRPRWWKSSFIWKFVNQRAYGLDSADKFAFHDYLAQRLGLPAGSRALSIGCGIAHKEMNLLNLGVVDHFDLFDLSIVRKDRAEADAAAKGLADKITFRTDDAFQSQPENAYDMIYWHAALHHMFDVPQTIAWCKRALKPGGTFVFHEFVGPQRFQWPEADVALANQIRATTPQTIIDRAAQRGYAIPPKARCPTLDWMMKTDPSESADSARILPTIKAEFPTRDIQYLGGLIYMLALGDIAPFVSTSAEKAWLRQLLDRDADFADQGRTYFASGICQV